MKTMIQKTTRSRFLEILLSNSSIRLLSSSEMRERIAKIIKDLDRDSILDPIEYPDGDWFDELDSISDIEFNSTCTENDKKIAMEFLQKTKEEEVVVNNDIITLESLKRIREKRRELAKHQDSNIVLTNDDYEEGERLDIMPNSYGRSPLHEAIGLRNIDSIKKYVLEGTFLDYRDNNGNTPYQMAFQEGYDEAVEIFKKYDAIA